MKKNLLLICFILVNLPGWGQLPDWLPSNGLVAWYPFNGNANDESGNNHHGTASNAVLSTDRNGTSNSAYSFNGTNATIAVPDASALRLGNSSFTISAWINQASLSLDNLSTIVSKRTTTSQSGYILGTDGTLTTTQGFVHFHASGGVDPKALSASAIPLNQWKNIIILYTMGTGTLSIYIDGVLNSSTPGMPALNAAATADMWIGGDVSGSNYFFDGKIDDLALYNRALLPCEINQVVNTSAITITAQPVSAWYATGSTAMMIVESPDSCLSYQWQASFGAGFLNLLNSGSYSGVNNDTLIINPVTVSMDNANYRCIISSCNACGDTSAIATLNIITGINETSQGSLNIYPNPSKDIFNIEVANLKNIDKVEVIDVMGKTIWQTFYEEMKPLQVNLSEFSSGIYTVKVTAGNSITTSRIVKD